LPRLADDAEERTVSVQRVLTYMETQNHTEGSFLYQKVDVEHLATVGFSVGGATALSVASRDQRVKAVVALDPVYHTGGPGQPENPIWDLLDEGPKIVVPTLILGAPPSMCNSDADYLEIYPVVGAMDKARLLITDASHCDFTDPGNLFCGLICGRKDPALTQFSQNCMTAWFNYYLHNNIDSFDCLFGPDAHVEISSGGVER
jgi:dienelactone hydrolase